MKGSSFPWISILCFYSSFLVSAFLPPAHAQDKLTTRVDLSRSEVLPYEPIGVLSRLANENERPVTTQSYYISASTKPFTFLHLSTRLKGQRETEGETYQDDSVTGSPNPGPPPSQIIEPKEVLHSFRWIGANYEGIHPFGSMGHYLITAGGWDYERISAPLEVIMPMGVDAEALKEVEAQKLHHFFTSRGISERMGREYSQRFNRAKREGVEAPSSQQLFADTDAMLKAFAVKHPKSRYADWAQWGRLLMQTPYSVYSDLWPRLVTRISDEHIPEAQQMRKEYELLAGSLFPYLRSNAWFRAGVLAVLTGDDLGGERLLNQAVALKADATMANQVELFRQQIKEFPGYINKQIPPKPPSAYDVVVTKLKAERYDIRGLDKNTAKSAEYDLKFLKLLERRNAKELTDKQFDQELAQLFDLYIRTYTQPLSPQAWEQLQIERKKMP